MPPARPLPLLLLPGMDGTGRLFAPLLPHLPATLAPRIVTYPFDQPLDYADLLALVSAQLPAGPFVVLGESFSGPLALRLAAARPPGLAGAILVASFVAPPLPWLPRWAHRLASPAMFNSLGRRLGGRVLGTGECPPGVAAAFREANAAVSPAVIAHRVRAALTVDLEPAREALADVPLLALVAARDRLLGPASTAAIRHLLPHADVRTIDSPHLLLQARPAEAAAAIAEFTRSLTPH
jgi:pimeloyl-[acyl-carrier protein] methyl ester esterase